MEDYSNLTSASLNMIIWQIYEIRCEHPWQKNFMAIEKF